MRRKLLIIFAFTGTALFAQDPNGFGGRRAYNGGTPGDPGTIPTPQRPGSIGPRGERRGQWGRMGMRGRDVGPQEFGLGRLLSDPNVRQQLGVTADQAAKIRQQESDFRKTEIRNTADLQIKRMDLDDLLSADRPDRSAIDSKLQEIGAVQIALEKSAIDNSLTMRDALTPAQRQRLQQMMTQQGPPVPGGPMPGRNGGPRGPQGGGRGGRGAAPLPNAQGQRPPNQQAPN